MDNKKIIEKYREQLMTVHAATVAIVSFVEIIAYFIFVKLGMHDLSLKSSYLWQNVVAPIFINVVAHLTVRLINASSKAPENLKNSSVIYAAFITTLVVSLFHRDYIVAPCAFVFPIILSAMYNDRNLLRQSLWLALFSLTTTALVLFVEDKLDLTTSLNIMVLYGYVAVSFICGILSIKFSGRSFSIINEQLIENSNLESKITLDQMTGLYNHKAFHGKLESVMAWAKENNENCCLAMVDVDDFKNVNDTYGHDSGDQVLISLANVLKECCGKNDYACRYGGEEFAVVFQGESLEEAQSQMEDAMKRFKEQKFEFTDSKITFSCGIARMNGEDTKEQLFARADNCLYMSKRNGKNRITTDAQI